MQARCLSSPLSSLFRPQVGQTRRQAFGDPIQWHLPRPRLWVGGFCLALAGLGILLGRIDYAEKITVEGTVRLLQQPVVVRSPEAGVVRRVLLSEGRRVSAGQPLLEIDRSVYGAGGESHADRSRQALLEQHEMLEREVVRAERLYDTERSDIEHQRATLTARHEILAETLQLLQRRSELAVAEYRRRRHLAQQGWISRSDARDSAMMLMDTRAAVVGQRDLLDQVAAQRAQLSHALDRLAAAHALQMTQFAGRSAGIDAQLRDAGANSAVIMHAPIDGVIADLQAVVGQAVVPGDALLALASDPDGAHEAELWLPSEAAGRVRPGMPVRLRYAGFPFQEFGTVHGEMIAVSPVPSTLQGQRVFRGRVRILQLPASIGRVPTGMQLAADVVVRSGSLAGWLLEPVRSAFDRL